MKDRETPCLYYICKGECTNGAISVEPLTPDE